MTRVRPNLFIVGAPKAGTSSLYKYLGQHPDIWVPPIKELHHFSCPEVKDTYYHVEFVESRTKYLQIYEGAGRVRWAGDFSPSYLFHENAAKRIFEFNPASRIVILLRDPAERAISHYLMDCRLGVQKMSLMDAIEDLPDNRMFRKEYIEVGRYSSRIKTYLETFGADQVFIGRYDDLVADPGLLIKRIFAFLEIHEDVVINVEKKYNTFRLPRTTLLGHFYRSGFKRKIGVLLPASVKLVLKNLAFTEYKPDITVEREALRSCFVDDIQALEGVTGWNLSAWRGDAEPDTLTQG